jgi:hypothetical protein
MSKDVKKNKHNRQCQRNKTVSLKSIIISMVAYFKLHNDFILANLVVSLKAMI